jgi:DNA polymerase epsilon subunit 2
MHQKSESLCITIYHIVARGAFATLLVCVSIMSQKMSALKGKIGTGSFSPLTLFARQTLTDVPSTLGLAFKREGLVLQGKEVMEFLLEQLREHSDDHSFLVGLLRAIDRQSLNQNFVNVAAATKAVERITMDVDAMVEQESLRVISGFDCPRHYYHESRKTFVSLEGKPLLHGSADDKAMMFRHRFEMIRQRLVRHELFAHHKLTTVESLLGVTGRKVVFGMLTRDSQGDLILEDLNNHVKIDISGAKIDNAFYTDHCMVLADGELVQGRFVIHVLTMPPIEEPSVTRNTFPNVELFGGAGMERERERGAFKKECLLYFA